MCGRYQAWIEDDELLGIIEREKKGSASQYFLNDEVFPGDEIPIIYGSCAAIRAHKAIWGFPKPKEMSESGLIINARAETATQKPMFRQLVENGRAIVLVSGYYEWNDGVRYRYYDESGAILMAALECVVDDERRYVVLTTSACGTPAKQHDRMPVFVAKSEMKDWLYNESYAQNILVRHIPCTLKCEVC